MEKPQPALARWAEWVAKSHGARRDKGALTGWNNWNFLKKKDVRQELVEVTDAVLNSGGRLRPDLIQIDHDEIDDPDGQKTLNAPWVPACAQRVGAIGARFGVRLGSRTQLRSLS